MKISILDVDSHNWPNLCLMKLSAYRKARGDSVEWWKPEGRYDLAYKSRVFTDTYSKDTITVTNADKVICGGTGYGPGPNLPDEVEHSRPDYTIYPQFSDGGFRLYSAISFWVSLFRSLTASDTLKAAKSIFLSCSATIIDNRSNPLSL